MRVNWCVGIRFKFLLIFVSSILAAGVSIVAFQKGLSYQSRMVIGELARWEEKYSFLYFIIFLRLTLLFFHLFSMKIIRRIEHINTCVNRLKEGNLDIRIPVETRDEIGNLSRGINAMVQSLKDSMERSTRRRA